MSRIGNNPIKVPADVEVKIDKMTVTVKGKGGELTTEILDGIKVSLDEGVITLARANEEKKTKSAHGLVRSLIQNNIIGVTDGFSKTLEVNGVGYKANLTGNTLKLNLGYSHDIDFPVPEDVKIEAKGNNIKISGIDKQRVGQVAATIREYRKPEPYKGKGIKYSDEFIIRKAGKAAS
ncbi:50S ribosomal protein L6 [Candidatus Saccharibacteria bacterium]|jgi:large subunit ribosomal protein L6|nr:50S ribosomal protein L6 [Candidatus Saccharibacteria bacterium]